MARTHDHDHSHEHDHGEALHPPVVSRRWRAVTVVGNMVFGALELAGGGLSSLAVTADGIHNVGDAATYHMQAGDLIHNHQGERLRRRRKIAHWVIATGSAIVAAKAGVDLASGAEHATEPLAIYAAGGSVALNAAVGLRLLARTRSAHAGLEEGVDCRQERDIMKHLALDGGSALAALTGAVLQRHGLAEAEQLLAVASGVAGAWMFRPTEANLAHEH